LFGSYDDSPEAPGAVSGFRNLLHHHVHQSSPGQASTFWAGLGAVRREAFERAGGFDEARYAEPSIEDIELGMRMSAAGDRIVLDPEIQGTHLKRWTFSDMVRTDVLRRGAPWVALVAANAESENGAAPEAPRALNLGWRHRLSALVSVGLVASLLIRRPRLAAVGTLVLLALNRDFYALLIRRRGVGEAALGVGLHAVHHLSAVASVPIGLATRAPETTRGRTG
ncbi:MAG: glycosyltransferase family 2 protein, partial [Solirubrobacterales bacterium]